MVHTLRFFLSLKCSLFHNSNLFGFCIIHILYTECAKIKKNNSGARRLIEILCRLIWTKFNAWICLRYKRCENGTPYEMTCRDFRFLRNASDKHKLCTSLITSAYKRWQTHSKHKWSWNGSRWRLNILLRRRRRSYKITTLRQICSMNLSYNANTILLPN